MDAFIEIAKLIIFLSAISYFGLAMFYPSGLASAMPPLLWKTFLLIALSGTVLILYGGLNSAIPWRNWIMEHWPAIKLVFAFMALMGGIFFVYSASEIAQKESSRK